MFLVPLKNTTNDTPTRLQFYLITNCEYLWQENSCDYIYNLKLNSNTHLFSVIQLLTLKISHIFYYSKGNEDYLLSHFTDISCFSKCFSTSIWR